MNRNKARFPSEGWCRKCLVRSHSVKARQEKFTWRWINEMQIAFKLTYTNFCFNLLVSFLLDTESPCWDLISVIQREKFTECCRLHVRRTFITSWFLLIKMKSFFQLIPYEPHESFLLFTYSKNIPLLIIHYPFDPRRHAVSFLSALK